MHKWLNLETEWWPTTYEAIAIGIVTAFLLLVLFDYACAKVVKYKKRTLPA